MASNPAQLENCKRMKISGLMLALLMVLTPVLTLGTASADAGGGSTVADVCDNDDLWLSEVHPEGGPNDWIEIQHDSNLTCSMEGWKLYDQDIVDANGADDAMILTFGYLEIDHIGSGGSFLLGVKDDVSFPYTFEFDISSNGDAVYLESPDGYTVLVATLPSWTSVDKSWQNCRDSAGIDSWEWTGANRAETPSSINDCSPINGTLPDMIVSDIYLSGSSNVLTIEVSNIGNGDVPAAEAAGGTVYIWIDQFSQPDWTYSWTTLTDTSFIVAGGMANIQPQALSGTHFVKACVDVLEAITESNENNNCHIMNLTSDEDLDDNSTGDDNNTDGDNTGDDGSGDDNNTDPGTGDNETGNLSCQLTLYVNPAALYAGDTLSITWAMTGTVSSQVWITVTSGWVTPTYYHSSIEPNTGSFSVVLPSNLDASASYQVYIESAENGQRTMMCWKYQAFDVLEEEPEACNLTLTVTPVALFAGDTLTLSWTMTGSVSSQVYISVFSGWGTQYYHSSIEPNTGSFSLVLPSNLDPSESYYAYIESAENGQRTTVCWKYAAFDVLEVTGPVIPDIDFTLVEIIDDEVEGSGPCNYSMLIVSDSNTQLMDDTGGFGLSTEYTAHPAWVNVVGAEWIWTTPKTATGAFTFVRPIMIPMDAYNIEMDLQLSADNGYAVSIVNSNGVSTLLDSDWSEFNYQSITTLTSTDLTPGLNHLVFVVNNSFSGPGGLTYRADIDMCLGMCNYSTTIVSDSLTLADGIASQATWQNSAWVNPPAGSTWIWDGTYGYSLVQFTRSFQLPSSAYDIEGTLLITADNAYNASMNGQFVGADQTALNFLLVETYSLTGSLQPGYNMLTVDVLNMHAVGGLAYAMNITWCQEEREDPRDHPPVHPPVDVHDHVLEDHHAYGHDEAREHSHDHEDGRDGNHDEDRCGWCEEEEAHTNANCVYPEYDRDGTTNADSCQDHRRHGHDHGQAACCQSTAADCASNRGGEDGELSADDDTYTCGCGDCTNDGKVCVCENCTLTVPTDTIPSASIPDDELGEDEGDESGFVVPGLSEDKQLVAAGAGAGSTLSLLGLALRRRLTGGL
jgi:hypothetical protein